MNAAPSSLADFAPAPADTQVGGYTGEVVYIYAFDVAYDMTRQPIRELLGQPVEQFAMDTGKRSPRQFLFYRPLMVRLPPLERIGPHGPLRLERSVKLLPVGALSITVRVPFAVDHLEDLVAFYDLPLGDSSLHAEVRQLAERVGAELKDHYVRPHPRLFEEEAYTVFCIAAPLRSPGSGSIRAEQWFETHRRKVAALLTQEAESERLSRQEADESTGHALSYYEDDLVVVDWNAALLIDAPGDFDETLYIMELANLQLAELEAYDRLLDAALERSYRDLGERPLRSRAGILRQLREIRIDLARFNDEMSNITKFFGDWHLARIYERLSSRFHLGDWHRTINGKLKTLDELYLLLKHDQTNSWMMILEGTIILLFVIDLVILVMGLK